MRVMSIRTMRPAPMFRWPTSLLPICPSGNPTKCSDGANEGVWKLAQQLVVGGLAGQGDGVVGGFSAVTPSVEDGENERMLGTWHEEDTSIFNLVFISRINCRGGDGCIGAHAGRIACRDGWGTRQDAKARATADPSTPFASLRSLRMTVCILDVCFCEIELC